jgi:hypothetical protein
MTEAFSTFSIIGFEASGCDLRDHERRWQKNRTSGREQSFDKSLAHKCFFVEESIRLFIVSAAR